jgi:O-antigen ligase
MGLPFLVFVATDKKSNPLFRSAFLAAAGVLMVLVLKTGSRGGLLAAVALILVAFMKSSAMNRAALIALAGLAVVAFPLVVSKDLQQRYLTMFRTKVTADTSEKTASAIASTDARSQLFHHSVTLTMRHPVFGVGLGQFPPQSVNLFIEQGQAPMWFTSHDVFALVAAETGIMGLVFFVGTMVVCFKALLRLLKASQKDPELKDISRMALCLLSALVAFTICGIFATSAYSIQMPLLAALTAALDRYATPLIAFRQGLVPAGIPLPPAFVNRRLPAGLSTARSSAVRPGTVTS